MVVIVKDFRDKRFSLESNWVIWGRMRSIYQINTDNVQKVDVGEFMDSLL